MQYEPAWRGPRSRRLIGRVLVVAAISTAACACGDRSSSGPVDTRYDFAACQDVWSPATDPDGSYVKCRGGAYEVRVMSAQRPEVSRVVYGPAQARVAAHDADVVPHQAPQLVPVVADDNGLVAGRGGACLPFGHARVRRAAELR